jgi:hypothetical protein
MGSPILMHDHEGVPPYPLETDDEFITAAGYVSQPLANLSYMVGYVYNVRLFRFLSTSLLRRRLLECAAQGELNITLDEGWNWAEEARHKISCLQRELPVKLRALELSQCSTSDQPDIFQTQRANIVVTAAIVEFALVSRLEVREKKRGHALNKAMFLISSSITRPALDRSPVASPRDIGSQERRIASFPGQSTPRVDLPYM